MARRVLITGVAGLIGSHLGKYLVEQGERVYGIDDLSGGYLEYVPSGVEFAQFNLLDRNRLSDFFISEKPDCVYHLAAYAAEGLSPFIRNFNYQNNLLVSVNVINECIKHRAKIVFTSSMAVYGHAAAPFSETQIPQPADPYGIAKYAVEIDLKQAKDQFGLDYSVVRPHNVIGVRQNIWDKYRNVIGIWIRRILEGKTITIFGDGRQTRAFSDIKFCLPALAKLMTIGSGEIFNLGADQEYTLLEVAEMMKEVAEEVGRPASIEFLGGRQEVKHAYCRHDKAKAMLGFEDATDLKTTMREMFAWARQQPRREEKKMIYEVEREIYDYWA